MAHALPKNVRPEFAHLEKDEMLLAITVPEGTKTGDNINVAGPDGRIFSIHIPAGCKAGSQMNGVVKKPEPTEEASAPGPPPPPPTVSDCHRAQFDEFNQCVDGLGAPPKKGGMGPMVLAAVGIAILAAGYYAMGK